MARHRGTRNGSRLAWWAGLLLVTVAVVSIGSPLVGATSLHASDLLQAYPPWSFDAPAGFSPQNARVSDTVDATIPARAEWSRRMLAGDLPLWSPLQAGGSPLAAIPNASAFGPLNLPYLVTPLWLAPALAKLMEMAVAGGFLFLLLRRLGVGRAAGLVGAIAFVNTGFQVVWTNWPQSHVGALVPALFWAVDRAVDRGRVVDAWPVALVGAAMWFEGFPAVTLWAHAAAGVYAVVKAWRQRERGAGTGGVRGDLDGGARATRSRRASGADDLHDGAPTLRRAARGTGVALAGFVGALGLAAVQLLPFVFRLQQLDISYRDDPAKIDPLGWRALVTLVVPDAFGNPGEQGTWADVSYVETVGFVGATVVVLALAAVAFGRASGVPRRVRWYLWGALGLAGWLVYLGGPLLEALQAVPVVGPNAIGRMRSLVGFFLAVLAGVGFQGLLDARRSWWRLGGFAVLLAGVAALVAVAVHDVAALAAAAGREDAFGAAWVVPAGAAAVAAVAAVGALLSSHRRWRTGVLAVLPAVLALEVVAFARPFWPRIEPELFYPTTPVHTYLADHLGRDRLVAGDRTLFPGSTLVYGLRSATAHTLTPPGYADLLQSLDPGVFEASRTYPILPSDVGLEPSPVLDRMAARYAVVPPATPVPGATTPVVEGTEVVWLDVGTSRSVAIPPGALRAVRLQLRGQTAGRQVVEVTILGANGEPVASGARRVVQQTPGGAFDVPVTAEDGWPAEGSGPWRVRISVTGHDGRLAFETSAGGLLATRLVRPTDDDLRLAFHRGATVYERETALPRIRWASERVVEPSGAARVRRLSAGVDDDTVVLHEPAPPAAGAPATIEVGEDSGDVIRARVDAAGAGYLVVADSIGDGWVASVDGDAVPLLAADHAFAAVRVPAGTHRVELRYHPPGWSVGQAVSAVAAAAVALAILAGRWRWWRRRAWERRR